MIASTLRRAAVRTAARQYSAAAPAARLPNTGLLIDNEWVTTSKQMNTENPATQDVLASVSVAGQAEVDAAVAAAQEAFYNPTSDYAQMGGYERGRMLNKLADLIEKHHEELAWLEVLDNGKPFAEAFNLDLPLAIQCYRYYAGWADKIHGSVVTPSGPIAKGNFGYIEKEPVGVVGQIIPWNFPILMQAWKLAPAIATGCSVVLKTAPQTPLTANRIGELLIEAGFPKGAVNIVPGDDQTGVIVAQHQGFDKLAFTGSTEVGRKIMLQAAQSDNLQRVTLELGGKSPMVVMEGADVDKAVGTAQLGLFLNQGQCCCASSRIFVHESKFNEFSSKIAEMASQKPVVAGWDENAAALDPWPTGPVVSAEQFDRVMGFIDKGVQEGATLLTGGSREGDKGYFIQPTVFTDVSDDMTIAQQEIFGPVMSIMPYKDTEEVISRANNSSYGLAACVMSENFNEARGMAKRLRAGTVWINCYDAFDASLPFGGFKSSGIGRELGEAGLQSYLESKTMGVGQ
jgi:aldehyde dehydrogenase (NAD+)